MRLIISLRKFGLFFIWLIVGYVFSDKSIDKSIDKSYDEVIAAAVAVKNITNKMTTAVANFQLVLTFGLRLAGWAFIFSNR